MDRRRPHGAAFVVVVGVASQEFSYAPPGSHAGVVHQLSRAISARPF